MAAGVVKVGSDFEAQMSVVASLSGATGTELDKLSAKAQEMGATTQFTATQAGQAFEYMALAGWDANQSIAALDGVIYAAGASGEDLALVADIITDGLTAFGESADQSSRFADILATTAANANTNIAMMGDAFKYVAPVAGALNYSMEDVAVAIGLMANSGIKASQAGTSLRTLFSNLVSPTDSVAAAMKDLNINVTNLDGTMKPLDQLLGEMRSSFDELTEAEKAMYASTLAGQRGMSGLLAIVSASDDDFDSLTYSINNAAGAAQAMNEIRLDNLQGDVTILKSGIEGLAIQIYESFRDPLREAVQVGIEAIANLSSELAKPAMVKAIDAIANGFSGLIKVLSTIVTTIIPPLVSVLGTTITTVGKLTPLVVGLGTAFATYKTLSVIQPIILGLNTALKSQAVAAKASTVAINAHAVAKNLLAIKSAVATAAVGVFNGTMTVSAAVTGVATAAAALFGVTLNAALLPITAAVAGIALLTAGVVKLIKWFNRESDELKSLKKETEKLVDANNSLINSVQDSSEAYNNNISSIESEVAATQRLSDKVYELANNENKTAEEKRQLAAYVDLLNQSMEGLNLQYDAENDALSKTQEELQNLISVRQEQLKEQAAQERAIEVAKELHNVEEQLYKIELQRAEAAINLGEGTRDYNRAVKDLEASEQELLELHGELTASFEYATDAVVESAERQSEAAMLTAEAWVAANGQVVASQEDMVERNEQIQEAIESYVGAVTDMFSAINEEAKGSVEEYLNTLDHNYDASQRFVENLDTLLERGLDQAIVNNWKEAGLDSAGEVAAWANATDEQILALNEKLARNMQQGSDDAIAVWENSGIPDAVAGVYTKALQESEAKITEFIIFGSAVVDGLAEGIEDNADTAVSAITDVSDSTARAFEEANQIHSPSRKYRGYGEDLIDGLVGGIESKEALAKGTIENLSQSMVSILELLPNKINAAISPTSGIITTWGNNIVDIGRSKINEFSMTVKSVFDAIPNEIDNAISPVIGVVTAWVDQLIAIAQVKFPIFVQTIVTTVAPLKDEFYSLGEGMIEGLWKGIESKTGWFYDNLTSFCDEIVSKMQQQLSLSSMMTGVSMGTSGGGGGMGISGTALNNPYLFGTNLSTGETGSSITINQNITSSSTSASATQSAAASAFRSATW